MLQAFLNMFKVPSLRNKVLFTLGMLTIYRIGFWIPLPGVDQAGLKEFFERAAQEGNALGQVANFMSIFTGGSLGQSTLFGLGIMPYISAAIIFQLLATVLPSLEALRKEGPAGQQKIQEYTRYATVGLCIIQAAFWMRVMQTQTAGNAPLVYPDWNGTVIFWLCGVVGLTAGTITLMWLGEQIDKYGIGNGASLIITAGILARMPSAIATVAQQTELSATAGEDAIGPIKLVLLVASFVVVLAGCILIAQGQRRIPIQQAKHTRGRRVYGGQQTYLPLRVNHGGVMPIIFASSLLIIPTMSLGWMQQAWGQGGGWFAGFVNFISAEFGQRSIPYQLTYVVLIYFFAYFWTTVQFQPREISINLRDQGSVVKGRPPGPRTAEYLEKVMERITYVGAGFLAAIAVVPSAIAAWLEIDLFVTSFLGGTALLITVSVCLDLVSRIDGELQQRNYRSFLSTTGGRGPRIRGAR